MLKYLIKIIHLFIIIFVIISPFVPNKFFKSQIIFILSYILFRNLTGYHKCGLTDLESKLSGKSYKTGFIYQIIEPFNNINKYDFYRLIVPIQYWILLILLYQYLNVNK